MEEMIRYVTEPLTTEHLILSQPGLVSAEAVQLFFVENRGFHAPWEPLHDPNFYSLESISRMVRDQEEANRAGRGLHLYLQIQGDPRVIGSVALSNIVYGPFRSCFLGYRMARSETCHGYMTEAVSKITSLAFSRYRLHRIEANIMPANHASIRLVENLGFMNEGYSGHYLQIGGAWEGHDHYVLLNEELAPPVC